MSSDTPTVAQSIIEKQEREIQYLERQLSALRAERDEARKLVAFLKSPGRFTDGEYQMLCKMLGHRLDGWIWNETVYMWCRYDDDHWDALKRAVAAEQRCATLKEERDGQLTEIRRFADFVRQVLGEAFSREELRNEARLILNNLSSGGPSK